MTGWLPGLASTGPRAPHDDPRWVAQPTRTTCGQACLAMVLRVPIADVLRELPSRPRGTYTGELVHYLRRAGAGTPDGLQRTRRGRELPKLAILRLKWPGRGMGHWVAWIDGRAWDPEDRPLGIGWRITSFLPIFL